MALIHELLYRDEGKVDLANVDFLDYLRHLADYLADLHHVESAKLRLAVEGEDIRLDADLATDCGLIASELISNALRHAFPGGAKGRVSVTLRKDGAGGILFEVADDGVGLPAGLAGRDADLGEGGNRTTGLRLVRLIAGQLGASLEFLETEGGGCTARLGLKARSAAG